MNYRSEAEPCGCPIEHALDPQNPTLQWNTLGRLLEWQRAQADLSILDPVSVSASPEPSLSESYNVAVPCLDWDGNIYQPMDATIMPPDISPSQWTRISRDSTPSCANDTSTPVLSKEFSFGTEDIDNNFLMNRIEAKETPRVSPGPQLPKIGRPRNTLAALDAHKSGKVDANGKSPNQARRRSQNREAQRAFRARQRQYIEQLARENEELTSKTKELEQICRILAQGCDKLRESNVDKAQLDLTSPAVSAYSPMSGVGLGWMTETVVEEVSEEATGWIRQQID